MYRTIETGFWDDMVVEELGTNSKLLLLYLLTSPVGNIAGCFPISMKRITRDTGLSLEEAQRSMEELCSTGRVCRSAATNEVLIVNWPKYNWSKSQNTMKAVRKCVGEVKEDAFREHLEKVIENPSSQGLTSPLLAPYEGYGRDTVSVTVPINNNIRDSKATSNTSQVVTGEQKRKHGEFSNVLLTDRELSMLQERFPSDWKRRIDDLSYYIGSTGKSYKSHYRTILSWNRNDSKPTRKEAMLDERFAKYN